jgi:hypothetical protein
MSPNGKRGLNRNAAVKVLPGHPVEAENVVVAKDATTWALKAQPDFSGGGVLRGVESSGGGQRVASSVLRRERTSGPCCCALDQPAPLAASRRITSPRAVSWTASSLQHLLRQIAVESQVAQSEIHVAPIDECAATQRVRRVLIRTCRGWRE